MESEIETSTTPKFLFLIGFRPLYFATFQKLFPIFVLNKKCDEFCLKGGGANRVLAPPKPDFGPVGTPLDPPMRFVIPAQYLIQLGEGRCQIFEKPTVFQFYMRISQKTMNRSDMKLSPACSRSILHKTSSAQNRVLLQFVDGVFVTRSIQDGTASHSSLKSPRGKLGQWL